MSGWDSSKESSCEPYIEYPNDPMRKHRILPDSAYFRDGKRTIDFILTYRLHCAAVILIRKLLFLIIITILGIICTVPIFRVSGMGDDAKQGEEFREACRWDYHLFSYSILFIS